MPSKTRLKLFLPGLVLLLFLACGHQREQQRNILNDLKLMQLAVASRQEIPPPSEDPERYGKWDALVRDHYEQLVKVAALNKEFLSLVQEAELWTSPTEWKDPQKVKATRKKAERLVAIVDDYTVLIDEVTGEKAMERIRSFHFGSRFNDDYSKALREHADMLGELSAFMATTRNWAQRMAELLALVDEKLVKMDGKIPKFEMIEDAERYRSLNNRIQEEKQVLSGQAVRYLQRYKDSQKGM